MSKMKIGKKLSSIILALVICAALVGTTWAVAANTYTATLSDAVFCEEELKTSKTVTLTVKAGAKVAMDALQMQVKVPDGWKITGIANDELKFTGKNYNNDEKTRDEGYYGLITWYTFDDNAGNVTTDLLATVTIEVPADTTEGEYKIDCEIIEISHNFGTPWEQDLTISTTLTVGEHSDVNTDKDHDCDYCGGKIGDCEFEPGEYIWSEDYKTCSVIGTCNCDATAEATTEEITSKVTKEADCQTAKEVTYTADFAEAWAKDQTKVVTGEKDMTKHVGEQTTSYAANGDKHTVTVTCECDGVISTTSEDHADLVKDGDHKCDKCEAVIEACSDANNDGDHKCDECEGTDDLPVCGDEDKNHICDTDSACAAYKDGEYAHADSDLNNKCDYCDGFIECETCEPVSAGSKEATCQEAGWKEYYQCKCGKYYTDATAETEIEDLDAWKADVDGGYIPVNEDNHIGEPTTSYTVNGEKHTVTVAYAGCGHVISSDTDDHDFTNGDCVCGAEKPVVTGLKGDVDLDGDVDMADFVALARHIGEVEYITDPVAMFNAEVTGDGEVNMNDFVKLAQFIGEVIDKL